MLRTEILINLGFCERGGKSVFGGWVIEQLRCPFGFILLSFAMNVVMGYQGFQ